MLLEKFSNLIDRYTAGLPARKQWKMIEETNPDRIYVENIRSFFGVSRSVAAYLCDMAVREGVLEKRIGYLCPNDESHGMLGDRAEGDVIPDALLCENCEALEREKFVFDGSECKTIEFYRLARED